MTSTATDRRPAGRAAGLLLLASLLATGPAAAGPVLFEDDFDTLDPTVWSVAQNGYPVAVTASGGSLHLGSPGTSSTDFPYVTPVASPLPAAGDFALEIGFRYTGVAANGDGVALIGPANEGGLAGFWQDSGGLRTGAIAGGTNLGVNTVSHVVRWEVRGLGIEAFLDGVSVGSGVAPVRPADLWLGHPTIGQTLFTSPPAPAAGHVDASGTVTSRWWATGVWTTFDVDFVRVEQIPEPATGLLLGAGLLAGCAARRGRRHRPRLGAGSPFRA